MRIQVLVWVIVVTLSLVVTSLAIHLFRQQTVAVLSTKSPSLSSPSPATTQPSPELGATSAPTSSPVPSPAASPAPTAAIYYPMTRYAERITNRWYGKTITAVDSQPLRCGFPFEGLHTGDDLEAFESELQSDVPVYAITDGTVRQVGAVSGYGGLIVIEHRLAGQTVTAYYGHINLNKTSVVEGQKVKAGQQLTVLGDDCSGQSGNERKHLHFAIRRGSTIDVRGYVSAQSTLSAWQNPRSLLEGIEAQLPQ